MARLFFSYCHEDETQRDQLEKHLAPLRHEGLLESWHDRRLLLGSDFGAEIDAQLERADVVMLLVSSAFLASNYCYSIEMERALARRGAGECDVVPVILRPCLWTTTVLKDLLAAPRDGKAITTWPNADEAYTDVARHLRELILQRERAATPTRTPTARPAAAGMLHDRSAHVPAGAPRIQDVPRSSNMRIRKEFSEADRDNFAHDGFEFMARFFEASLQELQLRHEGIAATYRRVDANFFTATVYKDGKRATECGIRLGGMMRSQGITYSSSSAAIGSSWNEELSVHADDQEMYFKALGMSFRRGATERMSAEQACELYWGMLIAPLQ